MRIKIEIKNKLENKYKFLFKCEIEKKINLTKKIKE